MAGYGYQPLSVAGRTLDRLLRHFVTADPFPLCRVAGLVQLSLFIPSSCRCILVFHDNGDGSMKRLAMVAVAISCLWLAACGSGGPVRRVSEPVAIIQQLTVRADGSWSIELRLENFSSVPMRFDNVGLALAVGGEPAGTLQGRPSVTIGPESADVATLTMNPLPAARIVLADALARRHSVAYGFEGTLDAAPENGNSRIYQVKRTSALSPVPGLPGVLR